MKKKKPKTTKKVLKKKEASLDFISMASHEIRNPVANIILAVKLLEENLITLQDLLGTDKTDVRKSIRRIIVDTINQCHDIHSDAKQSLLALQNLNDLYLMRLQNVKICLEQCNVEQLLNIALSKSAHLNTHNIKIEKSIDSKIPKNIITDVENVIAALSIVVGNAFRFSHPRGKVRINLQNVKGSDKALLISVQDFGVGMHDEQIENLLANLLDTDEEKEATYRKPSVQLSRAKMYMEAFGGSLAIKSKLGKGTTVVLTVIYNLPKVSSAKKKLRQIKDDISLDLTSAKKKVALRSVYEPICSVLLVEDDSATRNITYRKLVELGCKVDVAPDGGEAIRILSANDYDIACLDITLPDINGLEVMRQVKKIKGDKTAFVAISSHSSKEDEDYMLTQGMMALIAKPVSASRLKNMIDMVLSM